MSQSNQKYSGFHTSLPVLRTVNTPDSSVAATLSTQHHTDCWQLGKAPCYPQSKRCLWTGAWLERKEYSQVMHLQGSHLQGRAAKGRSITCDNAKRCKAHLSKGIGTHPICTQHVLSIVSQDAVVYWCTHSERSDHQDTLGGLTVWHQLFGNCT